jgi:tetratricopeptide (TPR) repeat protein
MTRKPHFLVPLLLLVGCSQLVSAQPAWTIDLLNKTEQKPEKFENRKLGSERLAEKKFTIVRRFFQNTYTHYNYFFNASNKIAMVIERAKAEQRNDFSKMLPFYPYSLEQTKAQAIELDSVIFKSTAGILLHDLRSNWVDNMYLLMGQAYFLRKDFDSAVATFQFINYNLYPRKKGDDDDQVVGTNYNAKNQQVSIANSEKRNIVNRLTSRPPSRNDALLWLARTLIEQDEMGEAIGLINTLQQDPNLPKRLRNDLDEIHAYWFYRQGMFDSSANYLAKALGNSATKQDRSRSEFLLGQLYAMQGNYDLATAFYEKASKHTVDPLLDIYARLNSATLLKGTNPKEMDKSIDNLVKMARRDKFENYRHILYFAAGEIALEKPDTSNAIQLYNRSLKYNTDQAVYKNKALLKLADIYYDQKQYKLSFAAYDSLASDDTTLTAQLASIQSRRNALSNLVQKLAVIEREDSLQRIAALPTNEREAFVRKLSRKLRKERGLTAEEPSVGQSDMLPIGGSRDTQASSDLFSSSSKGEWYFYNTSLRTKGFNEFKRRWGTRTNTDNWRRKSATDAAIKDNKPPAAAPGAPDMGVGSPDDAGPVMSDNPDAPTITPPKKVNKAAISNEPAQPEDLSFEGMMANLPLTPERKTESDQRIAINLFESGKVYQFELTDYEEAIGAYETSLQRFPDSLYNGELLLNLYTCYKKLGRSSEANRYKQQLTQSFPGSKAERMANQPESLKAGAGNEAGTKAYESIYTLFIEGKFDEALQQKKIADSLYGNNFWSPQLLYIEAVYHIRQRNDSIAIHTLRQLISLYPEAKMVNKAERLIEVLGRRAEIEKRLSELEVTRAKEDDPIVITPTPPTRAQQKPIVADPLAQKQPQLGDPPQPQATANPDAPAPKPAVVSGPFVYAEGQHLVLMVLDKVDGTYINEAKNAYTRFSSDYFRDLQLEITRETLDAERALVVFKTFPDTETAMRFIARARRAAPEEVAWLPANKYSFVLISESNLTLLQSNKNLAGYLDGLRKQFPGQF